MSRKIFNKKQLLLFLTFWGVPFSVFSANSKESKQSWFVEMAAQVGTAEWILTGVALALLLVILAMGKFLKEIAYEKYRSSSNVIALILLFGLFLFGAPMEMVAQESMEDPTGSMWSASLPLYFLVGVILLEIIVIFLLLRGIKMMLGYGLRKESIQDSGEREANLGSKSPNPLMALWQKMNKSVAVEKEKDIVMDHEYDGIRELDNDLPPWWKYGFYITIVFSVIYLARYHVFQTAPLQLEEYEVAMARAEAEVQEFRSKTTQITEETVAMMSEEADLQAGKEIFLQHCAVCHGQLGEGGIGPNLTDEYWIHGGSIGDIFSVAKYGVIEKGMTPFRDVLPPKQMAQVSSFIKSMGGTDPPNAKEPQGELFVSEEEIPEKADSSDLEVMTNDEQEIESD